MDNEDLYQEALDAIDTLAADKSVSRYATDENLKGLIDHIVAKIQALGIPG